MQPSFRAKANIFHELCQTTRSGIPLLRSLEILAKGNPVAARTARALERGNQIASAFRQAGFSSADCAVIEAGESSGRLEQVFSDLAHHYTRLSKARSQIITRSLYPVFVIHFAALLLPLPAAVLAGSLLVYLRGAGAVLFVFYTLMIAIWAASKIVISSFASSTFVGRVLCNVPLIGSWLSTSTASRFASTFSLFVATGGGLLRGMEIAGRASGSALIEQAASRVVKKVKSGIPLSEAFRNLPGMPLEVERAIEVGDHSGRLDQETARAADALLERTIAQLEAFAEWLPRILYVGVALFVGWSIIQTALHIGSELGSVLDG